MPRSVAEIANERATDQSGTGKGKGKGKQSLGNRIDDPSLRMPMLLFQAFSSCRNQIQRESWMENDKMLASIFRGLLAQFPGKIAPTSKNNDKPNIKDEPRSKIDTSELVELAKRIIPGVASRTVYVSDDQKQTRAQATRDKEWNAEANAFLECPKVANQVRAIGKNVTHAFKQIKPSQKSFGLVQKAVKATKEEIRGDTENFPLIGLVPERHFAYACSLSLIFADKKSDDAKTFWNIVNEAADRVVNLSRLVLSSKTDNLVPDSLKTCSAGVTPIYPVGEPHISSPHVLMILSPKKFHSVINKTPDLTAVYVNTAVETNFLTEDASKDAGVKSEALPNFKKAKVKQCTYTTMPGKW